MEILKFKGCIPVADQRHPGDQLSDTDETTSAGWKGWKMLGALASIPSISFHPHRKKNII
jgi:hypothetical protein